MKLSQKLKELRESRQWTIVEVAKKAQVPVSSYRAWEEGRKIPVEMLARISELYGISISHLLGKRQHSNEELALALESIEKGLDHLKKAISHL